ncbi:MAG: Na+/H+ antiporter NhaA [Candidatus Nanopelagicales bacterium]
MAQSYDALTEVTVGPAALHLDLSLATWAADGLLAVFFFVAGLELKHELVLGTLSRFDKAVVPVVAALAGMVVPALLFVATVTALGDRDAVEGWESPWPPTSRSRSPCSRSWARSCRSRCARSCSPWRSSTTSARSS